MEADAPDDLPETDSELVDRWIAEIREELTQMLAKYIEGPLSNDATDKYWLKLRDGDRWYRDKDGLSEKDRQRLFYLQRAVIDLAAFEDEAKYFGGANCRLPKILGCVLRIGRFTTLANVAVPLDKCKGRPRGLSDAETGQVKVRFPTLRKQIGSDNGAIEELKRQINIERRESGVKEIKSVKPVRTALGI